MTDVFFERNGTKHRIETPEDMMQACGHQPLLRIVMTDESGAIIGAGDSIAALNRSEPLFKALNEQKPMTRHVIGQKPEPRILFMKGKKPPLNKSLNRSASKPDDRLNKTMSTIDRLAKSLNIQIDDASDGAIDELSARVDELESTVDQVTDYLETLISKGVLPNMA